MEHVHNWHKHDDCRASADQRDRERQTPKRLALELSVEPVDGYGGGVVCSKKAFFSETQPVKRGISVMVGARTSISRLLHLCIYCNSMLFNASSK